MRPSLREDAGEGDVDAAPAPGHNWTIQIGAYADQALAKAQLETYAGKAQDVLARAAQIVAPITVGARPYALPRPLRPVCRAGSARGLQPPDPARPDLLRGLQTR